MEWQPTATIEVLRKRAALIRNIRQFFEQRSVLEVDTPALSSATITDVYLDPLQTEHPLPGDQQPCPLYLQTSPEYAMKRLLAGGAPDIFQLAKCFRQDEIGKLHNPEFLMLEWYRKGFAMQDLIDEVGQLLVEILAVNGIEQMTYQQAFAHYLHFDPFVISLDALIDIVEQHGFADYTKQLQAQGNIGITLFDSLLQMLFARYIETQIGQNVPVCITHFPASQAALAKLDENGSAALRFEFYFRGVELANGFEELTDAAAQLLRFEQDNQLRLKLRKAQRPIDMRLIAAMSSGLPDCSGVALGIDRLLMLALGLKSVSQVMSFDMAHA